MLRSPLFPTLLMLVFLGALFGLAQENYLFFHVLVELSTVVIGACGFVVVWLARANIQNGFFLILGITLLPVSGLTLLHSLAYKGMGVFQGITTDPATQLWVASRLLLAGSMALGAALVEKRPKPWLVLCAGSLTALALVGSILLVPVFPACFVEGEGLTAFKVWAEYCICGLLVISAFLLWRARERFERHVFRLLLGAAGMGAASEMSFTLYTDVYGFTNLIGHLFSVGLYALLLQALVKTSIQRPQDLLLRELALREEALKASEALFSTAFRANPEAMVIFRLSDGRIQEVNEGFLSLSGYSRQEALGHTGEELGLWLEPRERMAFMGALARQGSVRERECRFKLRSGEIRIAELSSEVLELKGEPFAVTVARDITEQRKAEEGLRRALEETKEAELSLERALSRARHREEEIKALLEGAREVLKGRDLDSTIRALYDSCKAIVGAKAGYVSFISQEGERMEPLFLDAGGEECKVPPETPMPIRGLRALAISSKAPIIENDFPDTSFPALLPPGHQELGSVLFAPLRIGNEVMGLLGLANKPGGFTEQDAALAAAFGELAAVALQNSRNLQALKNSEERLRSVVENAQDAIVSVDGRGLILLWNPAAEKMFGYKGEEILAQPLERIIPERFQEAHRKGLLRALSALESSAPSKHMELTARRKDGSEFPVELSLAAWSAQGKVFFTGIIRDVTERKRAEAELRRAHEELEERIAQRTAQLAQANQALRAEIEWRAQVEEKLRRSQEELKRLSGAILVAQEQERKQVAQEIHDSVGQILAAVKFATERALLELPAQEREKSSSILQDVLAMVRGAIEEVRRIQMDLRPAVLDDLGLVATMSWFCREFERVYGKIQIERRLEVEEEELPASLKIVIFRVLQEAMNNVAKHSGADKVTVSLWKNDSELCFEVEDNGKGMNLVETSEQDSILHGGMGILGMRERIELSGGSFSLESQPGKGTRVGGRWSMERMKDEE